MPSRRSEIEMTPEETEAFIAERRTIICATNGKNGWPHLMPLWYITDGDTILAWTFGKSQKVRNLERDPRATLQIEAGESYDQLRGVMLECEVGLIRDDAETAAIGLAIALKYGGISESDEAAKSAVARQAIKRVGLRFKPIHTSTWDHRKLGGSY